MEERISQQTILDHLKAFSTPERPVYLVGGAVRDLLLQRPVHDLDFVLPGETRKLANELACRMNGALYVMDEQRDTTRVILGQGSQKYMVVDFATLRSKDLDGDLRARDFTINAMAFDIAAPDHLIDPTGGLEDLREKRMRACSPASFHEDPVRVLRMVRQALSLGLRIEQNTLRLARASVHLLPNVSAERKRDELFRMLDGPRVALAIRLLDQVGALYEVLPELDALKNIQQTEPHTLDVWEHTLSVVQYLEQILGPLVGTYREETVADLTTGSAVLWLGRYREQFARHFQRSQAADRSPRALLFLAALYHDIAKPETKTVTPLEKAHFFNHDGLGAKTISMRGRALALSVAENQLLERIVNHHMRVHNLANQFLKAPSDAGEEKLSRRAVYRFFRDTGEAGVDICLLSLADTRGTYGAALPQRIWEAELGTCRGLLEAYWEKSGEVVAPARLLTGSELIGELDLKPGRLVGMLLDAIREGQAAGEIHSREDALSFSLSWLERQVKPGVVSEKEYEE